MHDNHVKKSFKYEVQKKYQKIYQRKPFYTLKIKISALINKE